VAYLVAGVGSTPEPQQRRNALLPLPAKNRCDIRPSFPSRLKTSVILSLSKDQLPVDRHVIESAAIFRGLILRQAQDDGIPYASI
jgi:hypothetical protein